MNLEQLVIPVEPEEQNDLAKEIVAEYQNNPESGLEKIKAVLFSKVLILADTSMSLELLHALIEKKVSVPNDPRVVAWVKKRLKEKDGFRSRKNKVKQWFEMSK